MTTDALRPSYFDLGDHARRTSTASPGAQLWFDRGLAWAYAFNHEEAVACFERAVADDSGFALGHWGVAYATGPNYNKPWELFDEADLRASLRVSYEAMGRAQELAAGVAPVEAALIDALARRFQAREPEGGDLAAWGQDYAEAMGAVHAAHPDDLDVVTLYADALMNVTAWELWDITTGEPAEGSHTLTAKAVLEAALQRPEALRHPGLLHMYIHLMEMSPHPEQALVAADALRTLVPDGGHLNHMPTHIDVLCGDYERVIADNARAVEADDRYVAHAGPLNFYALYRAHNLHFKIYGALFAAQRQIALDAARRLEASLPEELLRVEVPPMADWLEGFVPMRLHVMVRFGIWEDLIATPLPGDPELYAMTTALTHYARGVAHAASGQVQEAAREREALHAAAARVPESRMVFNNTCADILQVAKAMLDGELDYRRGAFDAAFAHLRRAVALEDGLPYDEPWGWMQPVRHALGALLLEQGQVEEACDVYAADLGLADTLPRPCQHPNNVWSLHGYHECLTRLGEDRAARVVKQQLDRASARADVTIAASCLCRVTRHGHCC